MRNRAEGTRSPDDRNRMFKGGSPMSPAWQKSSIARLDASKLGDAQMGPARVLWLLSADQDSAAASDQTDFLANESESTAPDYLRHSTNSAGE